LIVQVLYFAQARERAGRGSQTLELPAAARLDAALARIRTEHPSLVPLWDHLAIAVDGVLAPNDAELREGAEIALLPPVSGG